LPTTKGNNKEGTLAPIKASSTTPGTPMATTTDARANIIMTAG